MAPIPKGVQREQALLGAWDFGPDHDEKWVGS